MKKRAQAAQEAVPPPAAVPPIIIPPITCPECGRVATDWRGELYRVSAPGDWVECLKRRGGCGWAWPVFGIPPQNLEPQNLEPQNLEPQNLEPKRPAPQPVVSPDGSVTLDVQEAMLSKDFEGAFLDAFALSSQPAERKNDE